MDRRSHVSAEPPHNQSDEKGTPRKKSTSGDKHQQESKVRHFLTMFGRSKKTRRDSHLESVNCSDDSPGERPENKVKVSATVARAMEKFLEKVIEGGIYTLKQEWTDIVSHVPQNPTSILYKHNTPKNFPGGFPCLDATRVSLTFGVPPETDYIHANWVQSKLCTLGVRLILTQAPLDGTVNDFYRCVWQEKVKSIVMLNEKYEGGKRVGAQYWPIVVGSTKDFGNIRVQYMGNLTPADETSYEKLHLIVSYQSEKAMDCFVYVLSKRWPEGGVPESIRSILRTIRSVTEEGSTAIVHGGAGTGRSGVFAAILIAQKMLLDGRHLTVSSVVKEIREQRMGAVNTEIQYIWIFRSIIEYIRAKNVSPNTCTQLVQQLEDYKKEYVAHENRPVDVQSGPFKITSAQHIPVSISAATKEGRQSSVEPCSDTQQPKIHSPMGRKPKDQQQAHKSSPDVQSPAPFPDQHGSSLPGGGNQINPPARSPGPGPALILQPAVAPAHPQAPPKKN